MSFFEWLGRVIMLVLAGMITLSIISAIAAISSDIQFPAQAGLERAPLPEPGPEQRAGQEPSRAAVPGRQATEQSTGSGVGELVRVPSQPEPPDPQRWLEAITYALLALAGLAALGCLLLWRGLHQQRRIADALEALSAAPRPSSAPPSATSRDG